MKVRKYHPDYFEALFSYWVHLGKEIPFFFSVSPKQWGECLFEDKLDGKQKFTKLETFVAVDNRKIVGFLQCGQPVFAWDKDGNQFSNPQIGIIRHFYFDKDRLDVGEALFGKSADFMEQFPEQHAFYQIFGMSCNAHHGKLHHSMIHVDQFLREKDFHVDQENVYFSLDLWRYQAAHRNDLRLISRSVQIFDIQEYDIGLDDGVIGSLQIRFLEILTGGETSDTAYMTWVGIKEPFRRQGWGTKAIFLLISDLRRKGIRYLHLDTACTNIPAQHFYERLGFQNRGKTMSFYKSNENEA